MRKFTIQSKKGSYSIVEVEVELVRPMEDPSVMWLGSGEYKARVLAPEMFHQRIEKVVEGKKEFVLVPDVWCWHAFYESAEIAREQCVEWIRSEMVDFAIRKHRTPATEEEIQQAIQSIEMIPLKA